MTTLITIQTIAARKLGVALEEVQSNSAKSWRESGLDSLALIDVAFAIEQELGISIPDRVMDEATSLNSLSAAVDSLLQLHATETSTL
jgi:acyl carrier protein